MPKHFNPRMAGDSFVNFAALGLGAGVCLAVLASCSNFGDGTGAGNLGGSGSGGTQAQGSGGARSPAGSGGASNPAAPGTGGSSASGGGTNGGGSGATLGSGGVAATARGSGGGGGGRDGSAGGTPGSAGAPLVSGNAGSGVAGGSGLGAGGFAGAGAPTLPALCGAGPFAANPLPSGATTPTRIVGVPPTAGADGAFNNNGNNFTNIEGPVWIGDALYVSELTNVDLPPSRILKVDANDTVAVFLADAGTNGLAVDPAGRLVSANHRAGGIVRFDLATKMPTTLVSAFGGKRFNAPNDLTITREGTIYFTDPVWQNSANPQGGTRVYQLPAGASAATVITDYTNQPNGIALSPDERTLYVAGGQGVRKYSVAADGTVGMTGTPFGPTTVAGGTDGLAVDCAGNVYVAVASSTNVVVVDPRGGSLGQIATTGLGSVTNLAFGGADRKTLYITGFGSGKQQGLFKVALAIPGLPY